MIKTVLPAFVRPLLEPRLPGEIDPIWVRTLEEASAAIVDAGIAWVDLPPHGLTSEAVAAAGQLRWLFTAIAGIESLDLTSLRARRTVVTNGAGLIASAVAEYAVMGVLAAAKRFDQVVRAHDRREWLADAPGKTELPETRALIIGYGTIGRLIGDRLAALGVGVVGATHSGRDGTLSPDAWRARLNEFDWIVLAAPSTDATKAMIGASELAAMKRGAWLINIARGDMIDQDALVDALRAGTIGGAFLDPTDPEPLPADHPLWSAPNTMITMHLSGRSQTGMFRRAVDLFVANLQAFLEDRPMRNVVDLESGF